MLMIAGGMHVIRPDEMCNRSWGEQSPWQIVWEGRVDDIRDRHVLTSRSLYMNCSLTCKVVYISQHVKPRINRLRHVHA